MCARGMGVGVGRRRVGGLEAGWGRVGPVGAECGAGGGAEAAVSRGRAWAGASARESSSCASQGVSHWARRAWGGQIAGEAS